MTTDFRALCAELADDLQEARDAVSDWSPYASEYFREELDRFQRQIDRVRVELAAPEQGATDEEIMELMPQQLREDLATVARLLVAHGTGIYVGPGLYRVTLNTGIAEHCRAVLARWGRPAPEGPTDQELYDVAEQFNGDPVPAMRRALELWGRPAAEPVPVSERLPGPEDCDAEGRCWWGDAGNDEFVPSWRLCERPDKPCFDHWYPHWALPLPGEAE